jgi:hypothetical protein
VRPRGPDECWRLAFDQDTPTQGGVAKAPRELDVLDSQITPDAEDRFPEDFDPRLVNVVPVRVETVQIAVENPGDAFMPTRAVSENPAVRILVDVLQKP